MNGKLKILVLAMICLLVITVPARAQMPCGYEVTAIIQAPACPPHGFPATLGLGISEPIDGGLPNVVGFYLNCAVGPNTAFVWIGNENKFVTLEFDAGTFQSQANDISADGSLIVGSVGLADKGTRGFLFDGGELTIIPTAGGTFSQAVAVNSLRQIAGITPDPESGFNRAYIWEDEVMTLIEPTFGPRSVGMDISEIGTVVGQMGTNTFDWHGFLWDGGKVVDLEVIPEGFTSQAIAINNLKESQVVGWGQLPDPKGEGNATHAFLWESNKMMDLGTLPGFLRSFSLDINDNSTVVGFCRDFGGNINFERAFVWREGIMTDLNNLIPPNAGLTVKRADAINQAGQITGIGTDASGVVSFLLTPIVSPLGDLDGDCVVSTVDLLMLLSAWGSCGDCDNCPVDLDKDCIVSVADLLILLANWSP